jgi:hypothetical protein
MVMRKLLVVSVLLLLTIAVAGEGVVVAAAGQRPIEDFVNAQGTYCIDDGGGGCYLFVPPVANFIGWTDSAREIAASVDYAGLANAWAGYAFDTETTGTVTERPLPDGRAEVHVRLHTTNALSWVVDGFDFNGPLLFGHRAPDVQAGAEPALGESFLHVRFINTAPGAPLPDLIQLFVAPEEGQELEFISFYARANGPLADGTPGRLQVVQTGLLMTGFQGAVADGFPVESIILKAVGQ